MVEVEKARGRCLEPLMPGQRAVGGARRPLHLAPRPARASGGSERTRVMANSSIEAASSTSASNGGGPWHTQAHAVADPFQAGLTRPSAHDYFVWV
jgi:hypothetical protein